MLLSARRSLEAHLVGSGTLNAMSSTNWTFCGRSRTELDDERALACRFPTGIPYVRIFALFPFESRRSHNDLSTAGRGRVALHRGHNSCAASITTVTAWLPVLGASDSSA